MDKCQRWEGESWAMGMQAYTSRGVWSQVQPMASFFLLLCFCHTTRSSYHFFTHHHMLYQKREGERCMQEKEKQSFNLLVFWYTCNLYHDFAHTLTKILVHFFNVLFYDDIPWDVTSSNFNKYKSMWHSSKLRWFRTSPYVNLNVFILKMCKNMGLQNMWYINTNVRYKNNFYLCPLRLTRLIFIYKRRNLFLVMLTTSELWDNIIKTICVLGDKTYTKYILLMSYISFD